MDKYDIGRHVLWETEVTEASWNDADRHLDCPRPRPQRDDDRTSGARGDQRCRTTRPAPPADHRRAAGLRGAGIPFQRVGPLGRPARQTRRDDRRGRQRISDRTDDRAGRRPPHRVSAHRAVDVPESELSRQGRARCAVGAAASSVLRPLVPLPVVLAGCDKGLDAARVDPDYPDQQKAVSEINEITRIMFTEWITSQVGDDPDLPAKVVPDYPATGKRTLQDNGSWLKTLTRDNVELVRTGIDHIEADAVVTEDGTRYPADVIVYATGFQAHQDVVADDDSRPKRRDPQRALGGAAVGVSRYHGSRLPELLLHERPRHQAGQRRQPDLPLRMPDALHHTSVWSCSSPVDTTRWSRRSRRRRTGTNAARPRCARWCGHSPRSSIRSSRTASAKFTR